MKHETAIAPVVDANATHREAQSENSMWWGEMFYCQQPSFRNQQLVHSPQRLRLIDGTRLSAITPLKATTDRCEIQPCHSRRPGGTCQSKALLLVSGEAPAGGECEDCRVSLSLRSSETFPFSLVSFTGQPFCKCPGGQTKLHLETQHQGQTAAFPPHPPCRARLINEPLKSPEVNTQNKLHQSWDFSKLTPACDTIFDRV